MAPDKSRYPDNIFLFLQEIMPGTSNEYPQHMFLWRNKKNVTTLPVKPELFSVKERLYISRHNKRLRFAYFVLFCFQ